MSTSVVETALTGDEDRIVAALVLAFGSDPPARWMFPDPHAYVTHYSEFARAFGGEAFRHQTAYYTGNFAGVALWLPPGARADEATLLAIVQRTVMPDKLQKLFAVLEAMSSFHPAEPHWYLPMIGVDPAKQGRGHGSVLLRHGLERIDEEHMPAYLESTNPANLPLYERHGFELKGTIEIETVPPFFPMYREAR